MYDFNFMSHVACRSALKANEFPEFFANLLSIPHANPNLSSSAFLMAPRIDRSFGIEDVRNMTANFSNQLGFGTYSQVYHGMLGGDEVAVKEISFAYHDNERRFEKERNMLQLFAGHCNIVRFFGYCRDSIRGKGYLITEFLPISLRQIVNYELEGELCDWSDIVDVIVQIAHGLDYIHEKARGNESKYIFVDLKPENIMFRMERGRYAAKLIDLGSVLKEGETNFDYTARYMAPEAIGGRSTRGGVIRVNVKTDIYAFGILIMEMIGRDREARRRQRREERRGNVRDVTRITYDNVSPNDLIGRDMSETGASLNALLAISELALSCARRYPEERPTMEAVIRHLNQIRHI